MFFIEPKGLSGLEKTKKKDDLSIFDAFHARTPFSENEAWLNHFVIESKLLKSGARQS